MDKVRLCDRKRRKTWKSGDAFGRPPRRVRAARRPVGNLGTGVEPGGDRLAASPPPFPLLLCPPFPLAPLPVLPHLPLTFTLPSAPLPARLICVASLICIHMSQKRKRGFVGRRNRRGKRRYAGRWRLMKRDEKHSFRLSLSLSFSLLPVSPSTAPAPLALPPSRFCPHTL